MDFSIFTTCRPFREEFNQVQTQAIGSWYRLKPRPQITIIGDEPGTREICKRLKLHHVPLVTRSRSGIPLLSSLFWTAQAVCCNQVMVYVNSDIILLQDFADTLRAVIKKFVTGFLMVGPRWDMQAEYKIDFDTEWQARLKKALPSIAIRHKPTGIDYFAFTKDVFSPSKWPPLIMGRTEWDAWLLWNAMSSRVPTIETSRAATIIHQWHQREGKAGWQNKDPGDKRLNRHYAAERCGHGYVWETKYTVEAAPDYEISPAPRYDRWWSEQVGWTGWPDKRGSWSEEDKDG